MNMRSNALALTLGLAFLGTLSGCAEDHRWRAAMNDGNNAMRAGDYTHAEESFVAARKEAEVLDPQGKRLAETLSQLGEVNRELGRYPRAEALFQAHGITSTATYDTVPLEVEVGVLSSQGRRYLELLGKLDQLMPLLQTLEIHEVVTTQAVDIERAGLKRKVRDVANGARSLATRMRRAMNALDKQDQEGAARREAETLSPEGDDAGEGAAVEVEATTSQTVLLQDSSTSPTNEDEVQGRQDGADGVGSTSTVG